MIADFGRAAQAAAATGDKAAWRNASELIAALEEALADGDESIRDLIGAGFLEALMPEEPGYDKLRSCMGPTLLHVLYQQE